MPYLALVALYPAPHTAGDGQSRLRKQAFHAVGVVVWGAAK